MNSQIGFFGVNLTLLPKELLVERILDKENPKVFHLCNVHTLLTSHRNQGFRDCLSDASAINIVDGKIIELLIRLIYRQQRAFRGIRGKELLFAVLEETHLRNLQSGIIGGDFETLKRAQLALQERMFEVDIPVLISPPFSKIEEWDLAGMAEELSLAGVHIVWVAVGTPKQDYFSNMLYDILKVNYVCVGAAIGFSSGDVRECPTFISRVGLEWLFRLIIEPKRLWRRYLLDFPLLIKLFVKEIFKP
jgi:N-acetylglucosaminyldiphosphoundecaprenol N-acetyl-beta-D-mannosaminyltransferase